MSDLSTLFATDPLELSTQDIEQIVTELRAARRNFNLAGIAAKPKTEKEQKAASLSSQLGLSLKI